MSGLGSYSPTPRQRFLDSIESRPQKPLPTLSHLQSQIVPELLPELHLQTLPSVGHSDSRSRSIRAGRLMSRNQPGTLFRADAQGRMRPFLDGSAPSAEGGRYESLARRLFVCCIDMLRDHGDCCTPKISWLIGHP